MNSRIEPASSQPSSGANAFETAAARLWAQRPPRKPWLRRIASELSTGRAQDVEQSLKEYLARHPDDADALFLAGRAANQLGKLRDAESWLASCLGTAPDFVAARFRYAKVLMHLHRYGQSLVEAERLLGQDASNPLFRQLLSDLLRAVGKDEAALPIYRQLAMQNPGEVGSWVRYGDVLRATGHPEECVAAYRHALTTRPASGIAWWSLANLKTFRFSEADTALLQDLLKKTDLAAEDRVNLMFSLGKALEDSREYEQSFAWYARANAVRRLGVNHDWDRISARLAGDMALLTPEFLETRKNSGCRTIGPIFILGRPRSGSTLIEQILATHSAIEATAELPYLADIAARLEEEHGTDLARVLAKLDPASLARLGEEYLERVQIHRRTNRPFFIDKAPANYHQVGLILLILPNAKIIDARRHPAACCFSMFKHNYVDSNLRLAELGRVYRDYVALMAHFDRVAPGRIHRVIYENLVAGPEAQVRQLFGYLGLPFEEACLKFHETKRTVRTPSSEQVRRPISGEAVEHWHNFEPWLSPLTVSLGPVLSDYPGVPGDVINID